MATLLQFCRVRELIFVEETSKGHEPAYAFLNQAGTRLVFTDNEIWFALQA